MLEVLKAMGKLAGSSLHLYLKTNVAFLRDGALASHAYVHMSACMHMHMHMHIMFMFMFMFMFMYG